jgi:hypothetical protein
MKPTQRNCAAVIRLLSYTPAASAEVIEITGVAGHECQYLGCG